MADIFNYPPNEESKANKFNRDGSSLRKWSMILISLLLVLFLFIRFFVSFKLDWTWFGTLGFEPVFWDVFTGKLMVGMGIFISAFFLTCLNLFLIYKIAKKPFRILLSLALAFVVAMLVTGNGSHLWLEILEYFHAESFGITDPQFNLDIGFYVFKLPIFWLVYRLINLLLLANLLISIPLYLLLVTGKIEISTQNMTKRIFTTEGERAVTHVGILAGLYFIWQAFRYKLLTYEILFSQEGSVIGAGATDIGARLPGFYIMLLLSLVVGILIFISLRKNLKRVVFSVVAYFIATVLITGLFPAAYQKLFVDPDELRKEMPYLELSIAYTRQAYGLENLSTEEYSINELTSAEINANREIIDNIRLLDHRATKSTYGQEQEIRLYYDFVDVDVDRYMVNGKLTQVLLSARELNREALSDQAKTFNNLMFKYTHGFGLAMSKANSVSATGLPLYLVQDIPPVSAVGPIEQPRIYFGELTKNNVIVNTTLSEFDYPVGNDNQEYIYEGKNVGIPMTFSNKILLAIRDLQYKYLFSDYITPESQYLETRNIMDRVQRIAPFLIYDQDPYLVLSDDGQLYYLLDAYTNTDKYPYSQALGGQDNFNYMRNSVKIVMNAYSGKVDFYIFAEDDPIIKVYSNIFPTLFKSKADFPAELRDHIRYPEDLFNVQSLIIHDYHMTNPTVFFTREDRWQFGREVYWGGEFQDQEPYYSIIRLPGEETEEFILMRVFSPARKQNMVAWLAARSDGENYGKLLLYTFPKGEQIPGTSQVESVIDQNPDISSQLTLWGQGGSRVLRGNLLVYPVGGSLLYIEPLYLEAEQNQYPQLKKVFVYYNDTIVMEDTLEQALTSIFGDGVGKGTVSPSGDSTGVIINGEGDYRQLFVRLVELYEQGQKRIAAGDWAGYGRIQEEIADLIAENNLDK